MKVVDTKLPVGWANKAYVGLTATTGALADNHDVLSLKSFSDLAVLEQEEELTQNKSNFAIDLEQPIGANVNRYISVVYLEY